ncbi:hypothetical protein [Streptomyces virginiae]
MIAAAGIAEHDDEYARRWIAVRHATDHIPLRIRATSARRDGRHLRLRGDVRAVRTTARAFEGGWAAPRCHP